MNNKCVSNYKAITDFIIKYIENNSLQEVVTIDVDTNFVDEELLDSFGILSLIMTLENQFSVKFQTMEIADDSIKTIDGLATLVTNKILFIDK